MFLTIATLHDHHVHVTFASFSSLISISCDPNLVKFWKIRDLPARPTATGLNSTTFATAPIVSVSLHARDGIVITINSTGVAEIWDLSTGLWKASFQTPAAGYLQGDAKMINEILTFAWGTGHDIISVWESGNS